MVEIYPSRVIEKLRPGIRAMKAYTLAPLRAPIKVNQNENPFDLPDVIKQEVLRRIGNRPWSRYPDFEPAELREALAWYAGWTREGVLIGNGSNELIQLSLTCILRESMPVITTPPTFAVYHQMIHALGAEPLNVMLREDFQFDVPAMTHASARAGVIIICSPNNPTGTSLATSELKDLLRRFDGIVIVDEAYGEFAIESVVPLLHEFENLIVLKTFSKAFAAAGLRIGYLLASPELVREINKVKLPYNVNFFSQTAAEVALEHLDVLHDTVSILKRERARLYARLAQIDGLDPVPSDANFILVKTQVAPATLFTRLHERGILIRDVSKYPMLSQHVRITVGAPDENDAVIEVLKEICRNV